jgi:hypothetical protein
MGDALTIEVAHGGRQAKTPYPGAEQLATTSAGDWNRIAAQNNRVEFTAEASGS